jgi:hypothetical protein
VAHPMILFDLLKRHSTPSSDGCLLWTAYKDKDGYGLLRHKSLPRTTRAHRLSWELRNGKIPLNLCVLHSCDNPSCIKPSHLFLGTQADNLKDASAKGRLSYPHPKTRGSRNPKAKLTSSKVLRIRILYASGMTQKRIALRFGVEEPCIFKILSGRSWGWLTCTLL